MICTIILAILVGLVCVIIAYFASLPAPKGFPEPWKMRGYVMALTILYTLRMEKSRIALKLLVGMPFSWRSPYVFTDTTFDGVTVRIYTPPTSDMETETAPALVFIHGGGWVTGSIDGGYHFAVSDIATKLSRVIIVSVEYRLAPKHPFPAAIDDCTRATTWLLSHTEEYNVNPDRIGIAGDSAGGNLAAAVTQRLTFDSQYSHLPKLKLQALIYPALQAADFELPSYQQNGGYQITFLTTQLMIMCWDWYLNGGKKTNFAAAASANNHTSSSAKKLFAEQGILSHKKLPGTSQSGGHPASTSGAFGNESLYDSIKDVLLNPDFAPLMRTDLRGLPEAFIMTCQFDVLRDDGVLYSKRLEEAGVKVTYKHYDIGVHGDLTERHDGLFKLETGTRMRRDLVSFLKENL